MSGTTGTSRPATRTPFTHAVGVAAVVFSALYFASDVLELVHGGFSTTQLVLTYLAEAAIPLFVIGLYAVQRPHIGTLGLLGAVGYAYAYVFFTGTVLLALVNASPDWDALVGDLGPWVTVHGLLMVARRLGLRGGRRPGRGCCRAGPGCCWWSGWSWSPSASVLPVAVQMLCAGVRDLAFAGMGLSLLTRTRPTPTSTERGVVHVHA